MNPAFTVDVAELVNSLKGYPHIKYIAQDHDGDVFGYEYAPELVGGDWVPVYGDDDFTFLIAGAFCLNWNTALMAVADMVSPPNKKKHVHADLIKQWADGAEIQFLTYDGYWETAPNPAWLPNEQYRVFIEQDVRSSYALVGIADSGLIDIQGMYENANCGEYDSSHSFEHVGKIKVTYDAANKRLLAAEIVE